MIEGLREEAYVTALQKMMTGEKLAGVFGKIPLPILYGFDITPIPLYGIHRELIEESPHTDYCDLLRSTEGYALTDRCPFIHSTSLLITDDLCEKRPDFLKAIPLEKEFYLYSIKGKDSIGVRNEIEKLVVFLEKFTQQDFNQSLSKKSFQDILEIDKLLFQLKDSSLSGKEFSKICYETQFLFDLEERKEFIRTLLPNDDKRIEKTALLTAPYGGVIDHFSLEKNRYLDDSLSCNSCTPKIFESKDTLTEDLANYYKAENYVIKYGFKDCPYTEKKYIGY